MNARTLLSLLLALSAAWAACGQDGQAEPESEAVEASQELGADDLSRQLFERAHEFTDRLFLKPINVVGAKWTAINDRIELKTGLRIGFAYTVLFQTTTSRVKEYDPPPLGFFRDASPREIVQAVRRYRDEGSTRSATAGDMDFVGRWHLLGDKEAGNTGYLGFNMEWRHKFSSSAPADLSTPIGSLWNTTVGFNEQEFIMTQFWWEQKFFGGKFIARLGKIDQADFFHTGRFMSSNLFFQNAALTDNPAIAFPDNGGGFNLRWAINERFYLRAGYGDANGRRSENDFSEVFDIDEFFTAVEFGYTPVFEGCGRGNYRFTFWHTESDSGSDAPDGDGFAMALDQEFGERFVPFLRYSISSGGGTDVKQLLTVGTGIQAPFGREDDLLGVGFAWGQPYYDSFSDAPRLLRLIRAVHSGLFEWPNQHALRDQYVAEVFYRLQESSLVQITPSFQVIYNPSRNPNQDVVGVLSLRFRVAF
jgi:porin